MVNVISSRKISQILCEFHGNHFTRSNIVFFQRIAKLMKYEHPPEEVAVHLRKIETFLKERGVSMLALIGKRPVFPGQPEKDLHKAPADFYRERKV